MNFNKIYSGAIYLIDQDGNKSPEFGLKHYAIILKTNKKDLYLAFPLTTSENRKGEKYTIKRPNSNDGEYILLYQTKPISKNRIIGEKRSNGELVFVSEQELKLIIKSYTDYINDICLNSIISLNATEVNKRNSLNNLVLDCVENITIQKNSSIDYNKLIICYEGGVLTNTQISTKTSGEKDIEFRVTDSYGQKITKIVHVVVI